MPTVLRIHRLRSDATLDEMMDTVRRFGAPIVKGIEEPLYITVDGYSDDPRELYEIPEVLRLCERVVASGFLSLLHVNLGSERSDSLWGAYDIWAAFKGLMKKHRVLVDRPKLKAFQKVLVHSNEVANAVIASGAKIHVEQESAESGKWGRS